MLWLDSWVLRSIVLCLPGLRGLEVGKEKYRYRTYTVPLHPSILPFVFIPGPGVSCPKSSYRGPGRAGSSAAGPGETRPINGFMMLSGLKKLRSSCSAIAEEVHCDLWWPCDIYRYGISQERSGGMHGFEPPNEMPVCHTVPFRVLRIYIV